MGLMTLRSPAFRTGEVLPPRFSRQGGNLSPSLAWRHIPRAARSMVLAGFARGPGGSGERVLWLAYNFPPFAMPRLREGEAPQGATIGLNSDGIAAYAGPPDVAGQVVEFRLYALRSPLVGHQPLSWAEAAPQIAALQIHRPASIHAYFPDAPRRGVAAAGYSFATLGPYLKYSEDPRIRGGTVYAARDRASSDRFGVTAAIWDNGWTTLPDPAPGQRRSLAHNGRGDVVTGYVWGGGATDIPRACIWERSGGSWACTPLPTPAGAGESFANDVTGDGALVTGQCEAASGVSLPVVWRRTAAGWAMETLPDDGLRGEAADIAADGSVIVGSTVTPGGWRAVRWTPDGTGWQRTLLPTAAGAATHSYVTAHGDAITVGASATITGGLDAAMWDAGGAFTALGVSSDAEAFDHRNGRVVGADSDFSDGQPRAFLWTAAEGPTHIHPPGWTWSIASGIDGDGRIVGVRGMADFGATPDRTEIFLATPVAP